MNDITAPNEGAASSPGTIADELSDALAAFDHVDYNALSIDELHDLLAARETVKELCIRYRRQADRPATASQDDERGAQDDG